MRQFRLDFEIPMRMTTAEVEAYQLKHEPKEVKVAKAKKADEVAEKVIQTQILQYLRLHDIFVIHQPMNKRSQLPPGTPDFIMAIGGRAVAIEVKTESGHLSEDQERVRDQMVCNLWDYYLVRSVEAVKEILESYEP